MDHLWLPFLDQPQYDIVVFAIINCHIYNILVSKWKHGIFPIDIFTFNKELQFLSTSIIELINIDESLHENKIAILLTKRNKNPIKIILKSMKTEIALNDTILKIVYITIIINSLSIGGELIHI